MRLQSVRVSPPSIQKTSCCRVWCRGRELQEGDTRIGREHHRDAEQHNGFGARSAEPRQKLNGGDGSGGEQKRVDRDQPVLRDHRQADPEDDGEGCAERCDGRDAEGEGARQWIVQDGLHLRACQCERHSHE